MIVVTGSTGRVGTALVDTLVAAGEHVRALVQPGMRPNWRAAGDVEAVLGDFDDAAALDAAVAGADALFMLVPPTPEQVRWQRSMVDSAARADVTMVVKLSAFDSGPHSDWNMGRWHYDGERYLAESGLPHTILRPQYFMQSMFDDAQAIAAGTLPTLLPSDRAVGMIDVRDIAAVAATLLIDRAAGGHVLRPSGGSALTSADVAAELSAQLGYPVRVATSGSLEDSRTELERRGLPEWHVQDALLIARDASPLVNTCVADWIGRVPLTIADAVAAAIEQGQLTRRA